MPKGLVHRAAGRQPRSSPPRDCNDVLSACLGRSRSFSTPRSLCAPPPPPPCRTNWTRLVPPPVLSGHAARSFSTPRSLCAGARGGEVCASALKPQMPAPPDGCRNTCWHDEASRYGPAAARHQRGGLPRGEGQGAASFSSFVRLRLCPQARGGAGRTVPLAGLAERPAPRRGDAPRVAQRKDRLPQLLHLKTPAPSRAGPPEELHARQEEGDEASSAAIDQSCRAGPRAGGGGGSAPGPSRGRGRRRRADGAPAPSLCGGRGVSD